MRYAKKTIEELNACVDMYNLVSRYVGHLEQRSSNWWGCCPFHEERTPSFKVDPVRKSFYCFGCHEKGDAIGLVQKLEKLTFSEAVEQLARWSGYSLPREGRESRESIALRKQKEALYSLYSLLREEFSQNLHHQGQGRRALQYLKERKIGPETARQFGLGFAPRDPQWLYHWLSAKNFSDDLLGVSGLFSVKNPKTSLFWNRLIFPVTDAEGKTVAFSGRSLPGQRDESIKYINSRETPLYRKGATLFGLPQAMEETRKNKRLFLCEGNIDVLALYQSGCRAAVAPLGTAFTEEQARLIKRYAQEVVLCFDGDTAGRNAMYRSAFILEREKLDFKVIALPPGRDPSDLLQIEGESVVRDLPRQAVDFFTFLSEDLSRRYCLSELSGSTAAVRFLAPYMNSLGPGLRRELYIAQLAKVFGVAQRTLEGESSWRYNSAAGPKRESVKRESLSVPKRPSGRGGDRPEAADVIGRAEREFWAWMWFHLEYFPNWPGELLGDFCWESEEARYLEALLRRAVLEKKPREELLRGIQRDRPDLADWLSEKEKLTLKAGMNAEIAELVLKQKFFGVQHFVLKERTRQLVQQMRKNEEKGEEHQLLLELLAEKERISHDLRLLQGRMRAEEVSEFLLKVEPNGEFDR